MDLDDIRPIIADVLRVDPREITSSSRLSVELGADSLDLYQIMVKVQQQFRIHVTENEFRRIYTAGDIVRLIVKNMAEAAK
jgi:acyl carrier protein